MKNSIPRLLLFWLLFNQFCVLNAQYNYPLIDTNNLEVYYSFNNTLDDSIGTAPDATLTNAAFGSGFFGIPGHGIEFQASNSYLEIEDHPSLDLNETFTISLEFFLQFLPEEETTILYKGDPENNAIYNYKFSVLPGGAYAFSFMTQDLTEHKYHIDNSVIKGIFNRLLVSYDGDSLRMYIDGNGEEPVVFPLKEISFSENDLPLVIGNRGDTSNITFKVDELMIYDTAVSDEKIMDYYVQNLVELSENQADYDVCLGYPFTFTMKANGPCLKYKFYKHTEVIEGVLIQEGTDSTLFIPETSLSFFTYGKYSCVVYNEKDIKGQTFVFYINNPGIEEDLYIITPGEEIYFREGDEVNINMILTEMRDTYTLEWYHDGELIDGEEGTSLAIDVASMADTGNYVLKVYGDCGPVLSQPVTLIEGEEEPNNEHLPNEIRWDWKRKLTGPGDSYSKSICTDNNGNIYVLGYFVGPLIIEDQTYVSYGSADIFIVKFTQKGEKVWSKAIQGRQHKGPGDIALDSDGNIYIVGSFSDSLIIQSDTLVSESIADGFLAKFTNNGELIWTREMTNPRWLNCDHIEIDQNDMLYIGGNAENILTFQESTISGDWDIYANVMFLAKCNSDGQLLWLEHAVTDEDMGMFGLIDMCLDKTGYPLVTGTFITRCAFGDNIELYTGAESPFLVKYDPEGNPLWGATNSDDWATIAECFDLSCDAQNNIFLTGMHVGPLTFGTQTVVQKENVMEEIFLAKFTPEGICSSLRSYGSTGPGGDFGLCYQATPDKRGILIGMYGDTLILAQDTLVAVEVIGETAISPNIFIAYFDNKGEPESLQSAGLVRDGYFGEIYLSDNNKLHFAGFDISTSQSKSSETVKDALIAYKDFDADTLVYSTIRTSVCNGDSVLYQDKDIWLKYNATIIDTLLYEEVKDTIVKWIVSFEECYGMNNYTTTICEGDSIEFHDTWYSSEGYYTDTLYYEEARDTILNMTVSIEECYESGTYSATICEGDSIEFNSIWYRQQGNYTDTLQIENAYDTIVSIEILVEICQDVKTDVREDLFTVYPNPAGELLFIKTGNLYDKLIRLNTLNGQQIVSIESRSDHIEMDVSHLKPGMYFLVIETEKSVHIEKIVIGGL